MTRLKPIFLLLCIGCSTPQQPGGDYIGLLKFPNITYHIYINWQQAKPVVINTTFKAQEFELDTIYYANDTLHFRLKEFYSEYKGHFDRTTNRITGNWFDEDSIAHPLEFIPANPDTILGLRPRIAKKYSYQEPTNVKDGITVCSLEDQDMHVTPIDTIMRRIMRKYFANVHSLLVARKNCLVVEEYFYRYDRDYVYNIQSATKSIVSALTGIALERGEIKNLDETLCKHLTGYEAFACTPQNKNITLRQLLTMSTNIQWDEATYDYTDERNSLAIASNDSDQFVHLLSHPKVRSDSPVFAYNSLNHLLINAVLLRATHLDNKVELTERLLKPLGIENSYKGDLTPMGVIGDIGLRPRDMLKFGLLYLSEGKWNGKQIVSSDWVGESTATQIKPKATLGYGYFWWTRDFNWKEKEVSSYFAWGWGGQYIFVIPAVQVVIVMSGSNWGTNPEGQSVEMVEEILASIK